MADYGAQDTSTTNLGANQFPISEAWTPNAGFSAVEGGTQTTDAGGKKSAPVRIEMKDGSNVAQGLTTDAAVTGDNPGTLSAKARGFNKIWADVWDSVNHRLHVNVDNANANGQTTMSASAPVALSSDQTPLVSGTATRSNVAGAASDTSLLAANANRKGAIFYNDSTAILYLAYGAAAASVTSYSVQIPAQGYFELPPQPVYTGAIRGIWSAANGNVRITELS